MSDGEAKGLGDYLRKGGFIIFDDFRDEHWYNLEEQMRRVMPEGKWLPLDAKQQVYHSFFEIDALDLLTSYGPHKPEYFGMFEDNDPTKRLIAVANFNNDLGEYLGVLRSGCRSGGSFERGVQVRRELLHLCVDSLALSCQLSAIS